MAWVDESLAMSAMHHMATTRIVTKRVGELVFDAPGLLGDFVEIWCRPEKEGRSSLTMDCLVLVRRLSPPGVEQLCHSTFVYVAIDEKGRPQPWTHPSPG